MVAVVQWRDKGEYTVIELHCDGAGSPDDNGDVPDRCTNFIVPYEDMRYPIYQCRYAAKELGWHHNQGRDLCPSCFAYRPGIWYDENPDYIAKRMSELQHKVEDS
jgi:hypothetical protein